MVYNKERDAKRMALFPSLDYRGLYAVLVQLLEVTPLVQTGVDGKRCVRLRSFFPSFFRSLAARPRSARPLFTEFICPARPGIAPPRPSNKVAAGMRDRVSGECCQPALIVEY